MSPPFVLPNGDVLVAETNAPPRPEDGRHQGLGDEAGRQADDVGNTVWRVTAAAEG